MKVLHVITGLQKAAGTSVFCGEVCNGLVALGHEVAIAVIDEKKSDIYPLDPRVKLMSIDTLLSGAAGVDWSVIHIHALWSPILHSVARWAISNRLPVVWSPHGMLTPWAMHNKWWKKQLGWWLYQKKDLSRANLIHATAQSEVEDVKRMRLGNKTIVVPLGVKVHHLEKCVKSISNKKILLFVSRVQRKKGLLNLVHAWAQLPKVVRDEWDIRIVGPDQDNHTAELKQLCAKLEVGQYFNFTGPKYGDDLAKEYAVADLFVLPTHSENFGSVVIEALAQGVPVICTQGAPWKELETYKCGWWIDIGVEPLVTALQEAMALSDDERHAMGLRGRKLVEEKYTWEAVVKSMVQGYEEVLRG